MVWSQFIIMALAKVNIQKTTRRKKWDEQPPGSKELEKYRERNRKRQHKGMNVRERKKNRKKERKKEGKTERKTKDQGAMYSHFFAKKSNTP